MNKKREFDFTGETASLGKLISLINSAIDSPIVICNIDVDEDVLSELERLYPKNLFTHIAWSKIIIVDRSISTSFVLNNKDQFLQCFLEFDQLANKLMKLLAAEYSLDLNDFNQLYDLKRNRSEKQRGEVNATWNYRFHGDSCEFKNKNTEQILDVKIGRGLEFGFIDNFFLYRFIETTESLKKQSSLLAGKESNLQKVINVFKREGLLSALPSSRFGELALNKEYTNGKA